MCITPMGIPVTQTECLHLRSFESVFFRIHCGMSSWGPKQTGACNTALWATAIKGILLRHRRCMVCKPLATVNISPCMTVELRFAIGASTNGWILRETRPAARRESYPKYSSA